MGTVHEAIELKQKSARLDSVQGTTTVGSPHSTYRWNQIQDPKCCGFLRL